MTDTERFFCSDAARSRGDALAGTAPHGTVWILIEYREGWPVNGFQGLDLDPRTKTLVSNAAQRARARILLIRRPGRRHCDGANRWAVLRRETDGALLQHWGTWQRDEHLAHVVPALTTRGTTDLPPVILVCAHGLHDTCCAVRGIPVGRTLSGLWPDMVWECSHVGGDRFAANIVVVPDGVYYGGLDAQTAITVIEDHMADRIRADHLRGYTTLFPPQQAAISAVLRRFGPAGRDDYTIAESVRHGRGWHIRVKSRSPRTPALEVEVMPHLTPPRQLTCRGPADSSAVRYEVTSMRRLGRDGAEPGS
ncbi:sucrase ferredoxin [Streptomyces sp. NPDC099088]|uniref:sucrase ferredoxin n=1 Tax=Streptomyces sp. NPDC099088 TaxID=3366101 RepID=UPI0038027288